MECEENSANASMEAAARPHDELDYEDDLPQQTSQQQVLPEPDGSPVEGSKDDEMEEGEVEDEPAAPITPKKPCYFYKLGKCTWGRLCKFLHPAVTDTGAYQLIPDRNEAAACPKEAIIGEKTVANNKPSSGEQCRWAPDAVYPRTAAESAWEEGLRHARQMRQRAEQRRRQDKDFANKRLNLRAKDVRDGAEEQDEEVVIARKGQVETTAPPPVDKYCPSPLAVRGIQRDRSLSAELEFRHSNYYDYKSRASHGYHRVPRGSPRRRSFRREQKSGSAYSADTEWHDPWNRRASNRHARVPSTDSSSSRSRSCSSSRSASTFSSRSSYTTSRSCSSGSSRRYRRRRRSPSVKRSRPPSPAPLRSVIVQSSTVRDKRSDVISNSPRPSEEATGVQPFKPGRQISSHTLKKAEREQKLEEASRFSSDEYGSSRRSSRDSSPLSFSSTESSSCRSSEVLAPTTIGAQAAATRLANSRLRKDVTKDSPQTPSAQVASIVNKIENLDNSLAKDNGEQGKTTQRQKTSEQKTALLKQLKEIEEEIARKRKTKK